MSPSPQSQISEMTSVRGYMKPESAFHTIAEWEEMVLELLELQRIGIDSRGGNLSCKHAKFCDELDLQRFIFLVTEFFGYQLTVEVDRWDLLTRKNILDFIEDFVNHRFWGLEKEFGPYFPNIRALRIAYFYSRGDMEPYILLDDVYTEQLYGSTYNSKTVQHYTSPEGLLRIRDAIESGNLFDISTFTVAERPFFRLESNIIVTLEGNVRAGFRSDIKSMAIDNGRRACNMHRLEYPGRDLNNICYELETCDGDVRTSLWNEYIATPIRILGVEAL